MCSICCEEFKEPVITECKHIFCERCALVNYSSNPNCQKCGASTNGVFKDATRHLQLARQGLNKKESEPETGFKAS
jgi:RING finger protein 113A